MSYAFRAPTVAEAAARGQDNFGLLRLTLAVAVVCSHAYSIPTGRIASEPLYAVTGYTLGEHAVNGFFAVSGFLVAMSFRSAEEPVALRGRAAAAGFPRADRSDVGDGAPDRRSDDQPAARNLSGGRQDLVFRQRDGDELQERNGPAGVFGDNPLPFPLATVWTLRYELFCYAGLFAFGLLGGFRFPRLVSWQSAPWWLH